METAKALRLETAIADAVRKTKVSPHFHGVTLDDSDPEDDIVYRVMLDVAAPDDLTDGDLGDVVRTIEDAVQDIDPRLPDVRFVEAA